MQYASMPAVADLCTHTTIACTIDTVCTMTTASASTAAAAAAKVAALKKASSSSSDSSGSSSKKKKTVKQTALQCIDAVGLPVALTIGLASTVVLALIVRKLRR
jgi:uncharacterized lipoprotein NlpE involved in copper resistance